MQREITEKVMWHGMSQDLFALQHYEYGIGRVSQKKVMLHRMRFVAFAVKSTSGTDIGRG